MTQTHVRGIEKLGSNLWCCQLGWASELEVCVDVI